MAVGVSTTNIANAWLNVLRGTTFTGYSGGVFVKLHIGDPGATGANNAAAGSTTRPAITWSAASGGAMAMSNTPSWTNGGTSETLSHISFWDAASSGNFLGSSALASTQAWASGNNFALSAQSWSISPVAA